MSPDWLRTGATEVEECRYLVREEIALALRWAASEIDGLRTQLNAARSPAESKNDAPREMTADDLALDPLTAYDMLSPQDLEKLPSSVLQHLSMLDTDVAYAFWLGAEAA